MSDSSSSNSPPLRAPIPRAISPVEVVSTTTAMTATAASPHTSCAAAHAQVPSAVTPVPSMLGTSTYSTSMSKLPAFLESSRLLFVGPLLEGLSPEEQKASIACTQALTETQEFGAEERAAFDKQVGLFKSVDLSQTPTLTKAIIRFIDRNNIPVERVNIANWDAIVIGQLLPKTTKVLVLTSKALSDNCAGMIPDRCPCLELLSIENVSKLSEAALRTLLKIPTLKGLWVKSDKEVFSNSMLEQEHVKERGVKVEMVYTVSQQTLDQVNSYAKVVAEEVNRASVQLVEKEGSDVDKLQTEFSVAWNGVEHAMDQAVKLVPTVACVNRVATLETVCKSFRTMFYRKADLLPIMIAKSMDKLPNLSRFSPSSPSSSTTSPSSSPELQEDEIPFSSESVVQFPKPEGVKEEEWTHSLHITGLVRSFMIKYGKQWTTYSELLQSVGKDCKALDLSAIKTTDEDITCITKCFPHLKVLILDSPLITPLGLLQLNPLSELRFLRVSGVPHLLPSVLRGLEERKVEIEHSVVAKELTEKLSSLAKEHCESFMKDWRKPKANWNALAEAIQSKVRKAITQLPGGEKPELASSLSNLYIQQAAQILHTPMIEVLSKTFAASHPDYINGLWMSHLVTLSQIVDSTLTNASTATATAASKQRPASPAVGAGASDANGMLRSSVYLRQGFSGLSMRDITLLFFITRCVQLTPHSTPGKPNTTPTQQQSGQQQTTTTFESEDVFQVMQLCGHELYTSLRKHLHDVLLPQAREARRLKRAQEDVQYMKRTPFRREVRNLLQESMQTKQKLTAESIYSAFEKVHQFDSIATFSHSLIDLCRRLRAIAVMASDYFRERVTSPFVNPKNITSESFWELWGCLALTTVTEYFSQFINDKRDASISMLAIVREVILASFAGEDPIVLAHITRVGGLTSIVEERDLALLWDISIHTLEPDYHLGSEEGLLSLEENWRSNSLVRFKPCKPHGMPSREYMVSRILSQILRSAKAADDLSSHWTLWEKTLWTECVKGFLTVLDLSELTGLHANNVITSILILSERDMKALTHISLEGSPVSWSELRYLPKTLRGLSLSDCRHLKDEDLAVVLQRCPDLELLLLRNCEQITDVTINACCERLKSLRIVDLRGCFHTTDAARQRLLDAGKQVKFTPFSADLSQHYTVEIAHMIDVYRSALSCTIAALEKQSQTMDIESLSRPEKLRTVLSSILDVLHTELLQILKQNQVIESLREQVLRKSLIQCLSGCDPLAVLICETCGISGVKPLDPEESEEVWHAVFDAMQPKAELVAACCTPRLHTKPEEVSWRQWTLEYYVKLVLFSKADFKNPLKLPLNDLLCWFLARKHIKVLDLSSGMHSEGIQRILRDLIINECRLDVLHVSAEVSAQLPIFPPCVAKIIMHGGPIPGDTLRKLQAMLSASHIELSVLPSGGGSSDNVATTTTTTGTSPSSKPQNDSWRIAAKFTSEFRKLVYKLMREANTLSLTREQIDPLFIIVKNFTSEVENYCLHSASNRAKHMAEINQFLFHCVSWMEVPQLVFLEYSGVLMRLAENQVAYIWSAHQSLLGLADPPANVPVRDYILGHYCSQLLKEDALDFNVAFILQYAHSIHKLDLCNIDMLPKVHVAVTELMLGGLLNAPCAAFSITTAPKFFTEPYRLHVLCLQHIRDLTDEDVLGMVEVFGHLDRLEIINCPTVSNPSAEDELDEVVQAGLPAKLHAKYPALRVTISSQIVPPQPLTTAPAKSPK